MLFSHALIPTVKEAPADATNASHMLLVRGGYIRTVGAGMYDFLPLGLRVLRKIEAHRPRGDGPRRRAGDPDAGAPARPSTSRRRAAGTLYGDTLFRLKDRKGGEFHLGPTHEEIVTDIARREIKSYRDMPKNLYQIQIEVPRRAAPARRPPPLPRVHHEGRVLVRRRARRRRKASYETMRAAYCRIFDRMGLTYRMVAADSGAIGGSTSAEFQVLADSGEDAIVACDKCDYAANVEVATVKVADRRAARGADDESHDEGAHARARHDRGGLDVPAASKPSEILKSLLYTADGQGRRHGVVRGDHDVNEIRLARALGVDEVFLASDADVKKATGADVGFAGPVGFKGKIFVDRAAALVQNGVTGANETDHHFTGVNLGRDFDGEVVDIRLAADRRPVPELREAASSRRYNGIEAGHIFILGTHYSAKMGATFLDEKQEKKPIVMGCYGIGVSRLVATAIEQHHDDERHPLADEHRAVPRAPRARSARTRRSSSAAKKLYDELEARGVEVLWDDRDERPGVKFKDADLLGMPLRVTIGAKGLANGNIELKPRTEPDPKKAELVPVADAAAVIAERVKAALA